MIDIFTQLLPDMVRWRDWNNIFTGTEKQLQGKRTPQFFPYFKEISFQISCLLHLFLHLSDPDVRPRAADLQGGGRDDGALGAEVTQSSPLIDQYTALLLAKYPITRPKHSFLLQRSKVQRRL